MPILDDSNTHFYIPGNFAIAHYDADDKDECLAICVAVRDQYADVTEGNPSLSFVLACILAAIFDNQKLFCAENRCRLQLRYLVCLRDWDALPEGDDSEGDGDDEVCTKFATEIILRHYAETSRITATIIRTSARSEPDKVLLRAYSKELDDFAELPGVISEAASLMRIRGHGVNEGPAFAADVLRIEVVGDTGLHLTLVDLPGLIAVENDEQTEEDIALVDTLVDAYLKSSRTIILAVVQANNDIANQSIIRRARKFDRDGQRTVGIITKPDLINKGTEGRIACLAKNESTIRLKLGFFLLKDPSPSQLESGISRSDQIRQELEFFASWKEHRLDPSRLGIIALQHFLQDLHSRHIEKELPMVRREIMALLTQTDGSLTSLGDERQTPGDIRMFLSRLSMEFHSLAQAAIDGNYLWTDGDFFAGSNEDSSTRLQADIHCVNGEFSTYMRDKGQKRKLRSERGQSLLSDSESDVDSEEEGEMLRVTKQEFEAWVKRV
ncbi:hypothetical protein V502_01761 [Pseudogymnoascus sp. VKM F-4520 (FW-2644)]|nr:hypothetical protein V502_01761 [Pseudogymnoascus sp. VKM F-4520 (FW-2644)]